MDDVAERLWSYTVDENGCWCWDKGVDSRGRGVLSVGGRLQKAHRLAYVLSRGPIENSHYVVQLCRNPSCINPAHLELITSRVRSGGRKELMKAKAVDVCGKCGAGNSYSDVAGPYGFTRTCVFCGLAREFSSDGTLYQSDSITDDPYIRLKDVVIYPFRTAGDIIYVEGFVKPPSKRDGTVFWESGSVPPIKAVVYHHPTPKTTLQNRIHSAEVFPSIGAHEVLSTESSLIAFKQCLFDVLDARLARKGCRLMKGLWRWELYDWGWDGLDV